MIKKRFISMLVLLMVAVTGAMAQTEELLTTITLEGEPWSSLQLVYTESGRATLETSGHVEEGWVCPEINGWSNSSSLAIGSVTINPAEGYTITKVVFWDYDEDNGYYKALTDNASPFTCYMKSSQRSLNEDMSSPNGNAIAKIEVYGYAPTVAVTGVTLAPTSATLTLGETETVTLIPTVLPGDATDKSVTWSSSNEAVATVADGVVTAVAAGEATITVTTTDGAKTATCAVTVAAPAPSTYTVTLKEGTEDADNWTITPDEATTTGVAAGTEVKATYGGAKKVKSVKAKKKSAAPAEETVTWDNTNVFVSGNSEVTADKDNPYTYGGVSISFSGNSWLQLYDSGMDVTKLIVRADDVCTFTAPSGKKFTKIEITDNFYATFTAYGDWAMDGEAKAIWSGTASNTVTLGSSENSFFTNLKSIVFTMEEAAAKPAATVTTAPTAKTGVKAGEDVAIVNEGAAEGGTMMYAVTTDATQPASTDGFSATVPTAEGLTAGTYYVWYYVEGDASHTDSEISATGIEVTIDAAGPTLAATMTTAGMTVKVNFNYDGENYCQFLSNGDGTYTFQSGDGYAGDDENQAKALVVEGGKLVFKQNSQSTIDDEWNWSGYSVTFDTSNNTYTQWAADNIQFIFNPSFISVEVNGTQIAVTAAQ